MLPPMLPSFSTREYLRAFQPYFCRAKKGASTESSQIIGTFVTFVYTNSPLFIARKRVYEPKKLSYAPYFWIKGQFILKMGGGDRYQIPNRHQSPTKKGRRKPDSP